VPCRRRRHSAPAGDEVVRAIARARSCQMACSSTGLIYICLSITSSILASCLQQHHPRGSSRAKQSATISCMPKLEDIQSPNFHPKSQLIQAYVRMPQQLETGPEKAKNENSVQLSLCDASMGGVQTVFPPRGINDLRGTYLSATFVCSKTSC